MELTRRKKICGALWIAAWAYGITLILGLVSSGVGVAFLYLAPPLRASRSGSLETGTMMLAIVQLFLYVVILLALLRAFALWSSWFSSVRQTDPEWTQIEADREMALSDVPPPGSLECPKCNMIIRKSQNPCPYCNLRRGDA